MKLIDVTREFNPELRSHAQSAKMICTAQETC